jgi:GAF domain-containing protein
MADRADAAGGLTGVTSGASRSSPDREHVIIETMLALADTLIDDYDVLDFLNMVSSRCVALLATDEAGILLADANGRLGVVGSSSERVHLLELFELQSKEGPCLDAFLTGIEVSSDDLGPAAERWPRFSQHALGAGFRSVHCVPLRLRGQTIGALILLRDEPGRLGTADVLLARGLADMAAIGLLNARANADSTSTATQLQRALQSRVIIEQAKGVVAERHAVDIDAAFVLLRAHARSTNARLTDLAVAVINNDYDTSAFLAP